MVVDFRGLTPHPVAADVAVARARLFDTSVWVTYRPDPHESCRRTACGLGAVRAWDLLDTLMDLPAELPIPLNTLSPAVRRRLLRAPRGVVSVSEGTVVRHLVPPLTPLLAAVTSRSWERGLVAASRFAPYCQRMVVVSTLPADEAQALRQAELHGIGVVLARGQHPEVLVEPEPLADWQPTPAWWRFAEDIYGQTIPAHPQG